MEFVKTYSIAEFKALVNVEKIEIVPSKEGNGFRFHAGTTIGAVAKDKDGALTDPVISLVNGDTGSQFYMLHKRSVPKDIVATL